MGSRHFVVFACWVFLASSLVAVAQPSKPASAIDAHFVEQQFGNEFTLVPSVSPLTADFDGDGVEDVVIPAKTKNPLIDEAEHNYKVLDPYDEFFGLGDPRITSTFGAEDPQHRGLVLLIIHGAGPEAWRSNTPKAKFVIINLPFKQVAVKRLQVRKKLLSAIYAEETGGEQLTSVIFFDGKKYKYQPMGSNME